LDEFLSGPLQGLRVVELAGIGSAPHAVMIIGDLAADVVRVERPGGEAMSADDLVLRSRHIVVARPLDR
jgi:alpha-methylacyl-CoA racemase